MTPECVLTDAEHISHTHELLTHAARQAQGYPASVAWALAGGPCESGIMKVGWQRLAIDVRVDIARLRNAAYWSR